VHGGIGPPHLSGAPRGDTAGEPERTPSVDPSITPPRPVSKGRAFPQVRPAGQGVAAGPTTLMSKRPKHRRDNLLDPEEHHLVRIESVQDDQRQVWVLTKRGHREAKKLLEPKGIRVSVLRKEEYDPVTGELLGTGYDDHAAAVTSTAAELHRAGIRRRLGNGYEQRADLVVRAPDVNVPVLLLEIDRRTEDAHDLVHKLAPVLAVGPTAAAGRGQAHRGPGPLPAGRDRAHRPREAAATVGRDDELGTRPGSVHAKVTSCCGDRDRSPGQGLIIPAGGTFAFPPRIRTPPRTEASGRGIFRPLSPGPLGSHPGRSGRRRRRPGARRSDTTAARWTA
jgi:hypothetical protein